MPILVTGAGGQLGRALARQPAFADATFADRARLDLTDADAIHRLVRDLRPSLVVNAAAYTAVDRAESEPDLAAAVNATAPGVLAEAATAAGARLVHVSTDYVYDNDLNRPLREDDPTRPRGVYARTKLAGEEVVRAAAPGAVVLRTSWVYGHDDANFVRTMRRLGAEREELRVVADQIGAPTYADDLAAAIALIAEQGPGFPGGTYNYAGLGVASWYDFAAEIMRAYSLACRVHPIRSEEYQTPAPRPHYSVLDLARARDAGLPLRHWRDAFAAFRQHGDNAP